MSTASPNRTDGLKGTIEQYFPRIHECPIRQSLNTFRSMLSRAHIYIVRITESVHCITRFTSFGPDAVRAHFRMLQRALAPIAVRNTAAFNCRMSRGSLANAAAENSTPFECRKFGRAGWGALCEYDYPKLSVRAALHYEKIQG
ncbi:unnamed protein product [Leptosia nina]|uniref:Uncharacterized protein n=1 Tax=Leptosia nina TaxID=320188 RepID=A0AAV1J8F2_9NEOP